MARSTASPAPLASEIVEIEDRDGPRAAYAALHRRLEAMKREGAGVPVDLARLEQRLLVECCALSQGR